MSVADLLEPILAGGIQNTNYFNGRLLSAEELAVDQAANRRRFRQVGRVLGEGVAWGLRVRLEEGSSAEQAVVRVEPGLAINAKGEAAELSLPVSVSLVSARKQPPADAGLFVQCAPPGTKLSNPGLYLLTISPSAGFEGRAPMVELGSPGVAGRCGSRYAVEGVKFGLVALSLDGTAAGGGLPAEALQLALGLQQAVLPEEPQESADLSKLRNMVAHLCYGTERLAEYGRNPLWDSTGASPFARYGLLEELRAAKLLSDCEVPLALLFWNPGGVQFLDTWAVRRPVAPVAPSPSWPVPTGERRRAEGMAMLLQFQDQIAAMLASRLGDSQITAVKARERFRYLPPVGVVPLAHAGRRGFALPTFFEGKVRRQEFADGSVLPALHAESFRYPAVDLESDEMVWVYLPWQNAHALDQGANVPRYAVFAAPQVPYIGPARFDISRWDYSNYAGCSC